MKFEQTTLSGVYLVHLEPRADERGMFARAFCVREFAAEGLETSFVQANVSMNSRSGTVRGMHFQRNPDAEVKLVRSVNGAIYDVVVDMREDSATYLHWVGAELSEHNGLAMYVPKGFAHGYQALTDGATVFYFVSAFYAPQSEDGVRFDDSKLAIRWPRAVSEVSAKDAIWPLLAR
jgi:dTDP-4-dehydrorhamnose 3,5-epimerase